MTDRESVRVATIREFREKWPNAEHGPAHIVIADENIEDGHLSWCDGVIYAVQEERRAGGRCLYPEHSDAEIEATRRVLVELVSGIPEAVAAVAAGDRTDAEFPIPPHSGKATSGAWTWHYNRWQDIEPE